MLSKIECLDFPGWCKFFEFFTLYFNQDPEKSHTLELIDMSLSLFQSVSFWHFYFFQCIS